MICPFIYNYGINFFGTIMQYSASSTIAITSLDGIIIIIFSINIFLDYLLDYLVMILMYNFKFKLLKKYSKQICTLSWIVMLRILLEYRFYSKIFSYKWI